MTLVAKNESKAKLLNEKCMHDFLILLFSFSVTSFGILTHFARIDEYFRMQNTSKLVRESFSHVCVCVCRDCFLLLGICQNVDSAAKE